MKGGEAYALALAIGGLVPAHTTGAADAAVAARTWMCESVAYAMVRSLCVGAGPAGCARGRRAGLGAGNRKEEQRKIYRDPECCLFAEDVGCGGHPLVISLGPRRMRVGYCLVITVHRGVQGLSARRVTRAMEELRSKRDRVAASGV